MRTFVSSVSPKGQITLPIEVRRLLGIHPKDRVIIRLDGEVVTIATGELSLADIYRSVPALPRPLTDAEIDAIVAEEVAQESVRQMVQDE
ncbi:MAG: AbrB/MazE/SpoVT family DNA-binding domain-containing protein [Dehalococcoidia bacterium]